MYTSKLYANLIVGEFESPKVVKRSINSFKKYIDDIYVAITYAEEQPTDNHPLVILLKKYNANILFYKWEKNFAKARQFVIDNTPQGKDVIVYWQDADDVLVGGENLHKIADEMLQYNESAIYFDYWYQVDLDEHKNVREILVKHKRERLIRNDNTWKWVGPLHETLIEQRQENVLKHFRPDCYIVHLTDPSRLDKNIDRNIEILENSIREEQGRDPRTIIYLAKAYFDKAKIFINDKNQCKIYFDLALNLFHNYLEGSGTPGEAGYREGSGWAEERATAWSYIGQIAILSKHPEVAIGALQNAIDEAPEFPNYYVDLAMCYVMINDFKKAKHWLNLSTAVAEPNTTIIQLPREIKERALEVSFQINLHEQKLDWALQDAEKLVQLLPDNQFAQERLVMVKSLWAYNKVAQSFVFIGKYLEDIKEKDKLQYLVQAIPDEMGKERFASEMRQLFLPSRIWEKNEVALLCGPGFEKWSPNSVETGLGGSEEAVVYLSKELTKLGWKVTVYADPEEEGDYDGVEYKNWQRINPKDEFNVLILWRSVGFVDFKPKSKFTMLWLHDVPNNPDFTEERVSRIDKIAVLSEYHKSLLRMQKDGKYEKIPNNKIFVTANGLPEIDVDGWNGNSKRIIYASSPDRGLVYLLRMWPQIRQEVPEAELHVFYGWDVYDAIHRGNPARKKWKDMVLNMMKQDGITNHGRIGHDELHQEYNKSGIWAYPTDFTEISCISAMKAQKLGAVPVCTDYAALTETVKNGLKVDVDILTDEGQEEYQKALIGLLLDEAKQKEIRVPMMKWAKHYFDWSNVAEDWNRLFNISIQNPREELIVNESI